MVSKVLDDHALADTSRRPNARRLRRAGHIGSKAADTFLLELSKARNPKDALEAINALLDGGAVVDAKPDGPTFREVAKEWTSGKLHKRYPDHVKIKKSVDDDEQRFGKLYDTIGDVPLATFTLEDAERAMAKLPEGRAPRPGDTTPSSSARFSGSPSTPYG